MSPAKLRSAQEFTSRTRASSVDTPPPIASLDWTKVVGDVSAAAVAKELEAAAVTAFRFPNVGSKFLDFHLTAELGSGAFARVYLVKQGTIADRDMVLKLSTKRTTEPQHLGKLHHTNIVPIYSVHEAAPFQAVCMPYLGSRTLADILRDYRNTGLFPATVLTDASQAVLSLPPILSETLSFDEPERPHAPAFADREQIRHVLKLGRDLANGLQHAHERGILHLDIKPANVLLTDDGRALLLDFNLSLDRTVGPRARAGGTLPYMAPEQLEAYAAKAGDRSLDERTDLYAVGIVLYELLTATHPFPIPTEITDLSFYASSRRAGAAEMPDLGGTIPHSVKSIIAKLLDPDPQNRFRSAADLAEDLDRELDDRSLRHAANASAKEVVAKWCRRNTRLVTVGLIAAVLVSATSLAWSVVHERRAAHAHAAEQRAGNLERSLTTLRLDLTSTWDDAARMRGLARAEGLLAGFGWFASAAAANPDLTGLAADRAAVIRERLSETALLIVHARLLPYVGRSDDETRSAYEAALPYLLAAHRWNPNGLQNALQQRTADFGRLRLRTGIETAKIAEPGSLDRFFLGITAITNHEYTDAVAAFAAVCDQEPNHFAAQYLLASSLEEPGNDARASERLSVARALQPQDARTYLRLGAILLKQHAYTDAEAEFTKALACPEAPSEAAKLRGVCLTKLKRYEEAVADFTVCIDAGHHPGQSYLQRALAYDGLKNPKDAAADRAAALAYTPTTAYDFQVRGASRIETDPLAAIADFREAAKLNPKSSEVWYNIATIQSQRLHDDRAALVSYDRAIEAAPKFLPAILRRGLLRARLDQRSEAHADAAKVLSGKPNPEQIYDVACIYAITGAVEPKDEDEAIRLLKRAVDAGYRDHRKLRTDPDLESIRPRQVFAELLQAIYTLHLE